MPTTLLVLRPFAVAPMASAAWSKLRVARTRLESARLAQTMPVGPMQIASFALKVRAAVDMGDVVVGTTIILLTAAATMVAKKHMAGSNPEIGRTLLPHAFMQNVWIEAGCQTGD